MFANSSFAVSCYIITSMTWRGLLENLPVIQNWGSGVHA